MIRRICVFLTNQVHLFQGSLKCYLLNATYWNNNISPTKTLVIKRKTMNVYVGKQSHVHMAHVNARIQHYILTYFTAFTFEFWIQTLFFTSLPRMIENFSTMIMRINVFYIRLVLNLEIYWIRVNVQKNIFARCLKNI